MELLESPVQKVSNEPLTYMLSGRDLRSSIILIPLVLLGSNNLSAKPVIKALGTLSSGATNKVRSGLNIRSRSVQLILDPNQYPASGRIDSPWLKFMAGLRYRPGPPSAFFLEPEGISYISDIPHRTSRPLAFLSFPVLSGGTGSVGLGAISGEPGPGLLLHTENSVLFWHPGSSLGFGALNLALSDKSVSQRLYASLYRDASGTGGYGSYRIGGQLHTQFQLLIQGFRYPSRDLDPESKEPFFHRKGRSGAGSVQLHLPNLELIAAGEDVGLDQYRLGRIRIISPQWMGLHALFQGQTLRTYRYNSDQGYRYYRSAGLGLRLGHRHLSGEDRYSLDPVYWAQIVFSSDSESLAGEISFVYRQGQFYLETGFRMSHDAAPVVAWEQQWMQNPAIRFRQLLKQSFRMELGSRNFYLRYSYSEMKGRGEMAAFNSHFLKLQGTWCLQNCRQAPQAKENLHSEFLNQMKDKSYQS